MMPMRDASAGDMDAVVDCATGWEFNRRISDDYGGIVALSGPMGVSSSLYLHDAVHADVKFQSTVLYIFDPSALQRIAKKQMTYVSADWSIA